MIDLGDWLAVAAALATVSAAGVGAGRLLRVHLAQRTLLQVERQRSKRSARRTEGLIRLAGDRRATVRVVERDTDGFRMIEIDDPGDRRAA